MPNSGRFSNQFTCSRNLTTSPTTMTVGGSNPACAVFTTMSRNVPMMVRCSALVPHRTAATGVSGARPYSSKRETIIGRVFMPIMKTSVPEVAASFGQSMTVVPLEGSSWPVTTVMVEANVR